MKDHDFDQDEVVETQARRKKALATINLLLQDKAFGKDVLQRLRNNAREYIASSKNARDIASPVYSEDEEGIVADTCLALIKGQLDVLRSCYPSICSDDCIPELCSLLAEGV